MSIKAYIAMLVCVIGVIVAMTALSANLYKKDVTGKMQLINPPQQVLEGRVKSVTTTSVYTPEDQKETSTMMVTLCTGEKWEVAQSQMNTVENWFKSNLPPNKGCDDK